MKELIVIAGANGSGKTTFSKPLIAETNYAFLNADEIERELKKPNTTGSKLKAGRLFFQKLAELTAKEQSLILESTLAGNYLVNVIEKVKAQGYSVTIVYVFLESPEVCINRIKVRVQLGGHHVPDEDVIRRFYRSKHNFWYLYKNISDKWVMYYNSPSETIVEVATGSEDKYIIESQELLAIFLNNA